MADEPRRSGRATKGQHTKDRDMPEEKANGKGKRGKGKGNRDNSAEPEEEEDDAIIRCICGAKEDDEGLMMIVCEQCDTWQHNLCMGVTEDEGELENVTYYCERCKPEQHVELYKAIKRGEKPWEAKKAEREESKKKKRGGKKGGKVGTRSTRASDVGTADDADPTPKTEASSKRKLGENGANDQSGTPSKDADSPLHQKRRKSSHQAQEQSSGALERRQSGLGGRRDSADVPMVSSLQELDGPRKKVGEVLAKELAKLVAEESKSGGYRVPDGHTPSSLATRLALEIEHGLAVHHEDQKTYGEQFRTVHFNIKNNKSLFKRLLSGSLEPSELATMSSDDMASDELQKKMAAMKEEADKQSIMIQEEAPRVRKTHKGDEVVERERAPKQEDNAFAAPLRRRPTEDTEMQNRDQDDDENMVELPEDVGGRPPLNVNTSGSPTQAHMRKGSATNFNINQVWDSVHSPDEQSRPLQQPPRRRSSGVKQDSAHPPQSAIVDTDVDRLLNDDPDDLSPDQPDAPDPDALWNGEIHMAGLVGMHASAKWVAGGDPSRRFPWSHLLTPVLEVNGRIPVSSADEYVYGMRSARGPTDVVVLAITPSRSDTHKFDTMFEYFFSRSRWGVCQTHHFEPLKDMYLVPIDAGPGPLPNFLRHLEDNIIPAERDSKMLLVTMIIRAKSPPASASATPLVGDAPTGFPAAPSQSPSVPFSASPVSAGPGGQSQPQSYAPQGPPAPVNPDLVPPLAASILREYVSAPTVLLMLGAVPDMNRDQLTNLRHILERVPETRDNISALSAHLRETSEAGG